MDKGLILAALDRARSKPFPLDAGRYHERQRQLLVAWAAELARNEEQNLFCLPISCVLVALGVDWKEACQWMHSIRGDVIDCVAEHCGPRPAVYRYMGSQSLDDAEIAREAALNEDERPMQRQILRKWMETDPRLAFDFLEKLRGEGLTAFETISGAAGEPPTIYRYTADKPYGERVEGETKMPEEVEEFLEGVAQTPEQEAARWNCRPRDVMLVGSFIEEYLQRAPGQVIPMMEIYRHFRQLAASNVGRNTFYALARTFGVEDDYGQSGGRLYAKDWAWAVAPHSQAEPMAGADRVGALDEPAPTEEPPSKTPAGRDGYSCGNCQWSQPVGTSELWVECRHNPPVGRQVCPFPVVSVAGWCREHGPNAAMQRAWQSLYAETMLA